MSVKQEIEAVAHRLTQRHGTLMRLMRGVLYTDLDEPLAGQEARFELLLMLEELESRPPVAKALQSLSFTDGDTKITQAHQKAISVARVLISQEAEVKSALDALYLAVSGS